jgi:glycogen debranching enzyme
VDVAAVRERLWQDVDRLRAPEGYLRAGMPRYATLFGRDSLIAAWQTLSTDPSIAAATLRVLARFQGRRENPKSEEEPGKILHEHRFDAESRAELPKWDFPYYGSVDSTPLFLIVADAYVGATGDGSLVDELWDAFEAAYRWMTEYGDKDRDGYVEYARKNPDGLFHQGWKDGAQDHLRIAPPVAMVEVQGYAVAAHRAYASLARRRGACGAAERAESAATRTREALNRDFWIPDLRFFALALDGSKRPRRAVTSNPGHLLVCNAVAAGHVDPLVRRLFEEDMWTPYGIRTHSSSESDFDPYGYHTGTIWPHDNWFVYRGLQALGRTTEAGRVREALIRVWEELGKIPELYAVVEGTPVDLSREGSPTRANPLQAWSSAGLLDMIRSD